MLSRTLRSVSVVSRVGRLAGSLPSKSLVASQFSKFTPSCQLLLSHPFSTEKAKTDDAEPAQATEKKDNAVAKFDYDEYDDYEEPKTAGQKVKFYSVVAMRLALLALGAVCVVFTARELFPGRMNPNSLFSEVFEILRYNEEIMRMAGDGMKAFGRDVGRNTEGRRNHIDSYQYKAEDGSNRTRIRFNIKGEKGKVVVWAEISDRMAANEYVYIVCQNARTGRVFTLHDNRDQLETDLMTNTEMASDNPFLKFFNKTAEPAQANK